MTWILIAVLVLLAMLPKMLEGKRGKARIMAIREYFDAMGDGQDYASEFIPVDNGPSGKTPLDCL